MSDPTSNKHFKEKIALAGIIISFGALIVSAIGIQTQLQGVDDQLKQTAALGSAQYVLAMSNELNTPHYEGIMSAIEGNPHTYSPLPNGYTETDLDDYMGKFETIGDLYRDNVISFQMAYDEFVYDTEKAYCNKDVQTEIQSDREEDGVLTGTDAFWSGFQDMATAFLARDGYSCTSTVLDNL